MNTPEPAIVRALKIDLTGIPALLDAEGIRKHIAPVSRTLLYELSARGEIETASLGIGRGKRVFVTASVVDWIIRKHATTLRPNMGQRGKEGK